MNDIFVKISKWTKHQEGYFAYWICPYCSYKLQLVADNTPLPSNCPSCKHIVDLP